MGTKTEYCTNHPGKKAYGICHHCGKHFCKDCLTEGLEFNSCSNPECLKTNESKLLPREIQCPSCNNIFILNDKERMSIKIHCPECESLINYSSNPPVVLKPKNYVEATWSMNQADLFLIKSLLDDAEIDYYTTGENFLSVDPLIQPARFFVLEEQVETANELIKESELSVSGISFREIEEE